jgi:hypothetical protein
MEVFIINIAALALKTAGGERGEFCNFADWIVEKGIYIKISMFSFAPIHIYWLLCALVKVHDRLEFDQNCNGHKS